MRKALGILLVLAALLGTADTAAASAEANQQFFLAGPAEGPSITIAASGVITGIGSLTAESVVLHPIDNTYEEVDIAVIGNGTLTLRIAGQFSVWPFTLNPGSCTQHGTLAGTWAITAATGTFTGATGHGTFRGGFFTYARPTPTGCDDANLKGFVAGPMTGTVRLIL